MLHFEILTMVALSTINYTCPLCRAKATRGAEVSFWQLTCRAGLHWLQAALCKIPPSTAGPGSALNGIQWFIGKNIGIGSDALPWVPLAKGCQASPKFKVVLLNHGIKDQICRNSNGISPFTSKSQLDGVVARPELSLPSCCPHSSLPGRILGFSDASKERIHWF